MATETFTEPLPETNDDPRRLLAKLVSASLAPRTLTGLGNLGTGDTLRVFGDSTTDNANSWADQIVAEYNLTHQDYATAGDTVSDMLWKALPLTVDDDAQTAVQGGINDGVNYVNYPNHWQMINGVFRRIMLHHLVADSAKLYANNSRVALVGTWTDDTKFLSGSRAGQNKVTNTNGDTATFSVYGTVVYIATRLVNAATGGTFTVTIDGVNMGTVNAFTVAGAEGGLPSATYNQTPTVLRYAGLTEAMHTVVITVTSATNAANKVWLDWASGNMDCAGTATVPGPVLFVCNASRKTPAAYGSSGGSDSATRQINELWAELVTTYAADGHRVYLVPFAAYYDPNLSGHSTDGTHPITAGKARQYQAFRNVFTALRCGAFQNPLRFLTQLSFGAQAAQSGTIRLPYGSSLWARNAGNTADVEALTSIAGGVFRFGGAFIVDPTNGVLRMGDTYAGSATPRATWTFEPIPGSGTNIAGSNTVVRGGQSTGNADGGYFEVQVCDAGSSGAAANSFFTALRVLKSGLTDQYNKAGVPVRLGGTFDKLTTSYSEAAAGVENAWQTSLSASFLQDAGDSLEFVVGGTFANTANNKRVRVILGATVIYDSGAAVAPQNKAWAIRGSVTRYSVTSWRALCTLSTDAAAITADRTQRVSGADNLGTALNFTVEITGGAAADVVLEQGNIQRHPNR